MRGHPVLLVSTLHSLLLTLIVTAAPPRSKSNEKFVEAGDVDVFENPVSSDTISLHVTTPSNVYKIQLQHAPPILHRRIQTILTEANQIHEFVHTMGKPDQEIQLLDDQFVRSPETGAVLSVTKESDGSFNVEGQLNHETVIVPPSADLRHKRATKSQKHTVYRTIKTDPQDFQIDRKKMFGSEEQIINSLLREEFDNSYGKDVNIQHLIENYRYIDRSEELNDRFTDFDDDDDDDYKEVPSIFDSEETWKSHQRQAEARINFIHDRDKDDDSNRNLFMKSSKQFLRSIFSSHSRIMHQSGEISREKRELQNPNYGLESSTPQSNKVITDDKANNVVPYNGPTESFLKQITTLATQSQIPRPHLDSDELFNEMIQNQLESWKIDFSKSTFDNPVISDRSKTNRVKGLFKADRIKRQIPVELQLNDNLRLLLGKTAHGVKFQQAKFTIEVHAVVDVSLYKEFNYNWKTLQLFILHFWQSVNARFQALVSPQVQLKIKAISKIMFPGFQPFIENNRIANTSDWVDVDNLLEDFKSYVQTQFELNSMVPDHDVAFLMTGENLCKRKLDGSWSKKSRGIAYVRGACISARRFQNETFDVGIAEVGRSFSGVLTATHELAHLLGAFHDGEKNALPCPSSSGYIMGNVWKDPLKFNQFSHCSKLNMKSFVENTWYANCLSENVDHKNSMTYTFPKEHPGQVFSLEEQCYHFIGGVPCKSVPLASQCGRLCCEKWSQVFKSREPAADGTMCGNDMSKRPMCHGGFHLTKARRAPIG